MGERRNQRLLAREDVLSQVWRKGSSTENIIGQKISQYLEEWQRQEDRCKARQQRQQQHQREAIARSAASAARIERRQRKVERDARWKWMNRPDITMADLLGNR